MYQDTNLANELDLLSLDVLDDKDLELGQEVQAEIVDCVAEDRFLDKEHIALGFLDLLDHVEQICPLLLEDLVHLPVVVDNNLVLHVWLGRAKLELYQTDPCLLFYCWASGALDYRLVQDQTVRHFTVFDSAAWFLDYPDVLQVYVVGSLGVDDLEHRVDGHGGQLRLLCNDLGRKRGCSGL